MEFMGKKLEDIVVTLPFADGTSVDCGVYSYFEVNTYQKKRDGWISLDYVNRI